MKKLLLCLALSFSSLGYAATPSEQSVRELMVLEDTKSLVGLSMLDIKDSILELASIPELEENMAADHPDEIAALKKSVETIMQNELSWKVLEPEIVKIYRKTYSQSDIDGMIKYYKTKAGQAAVKKMPNAIKKIGDHTEKQMEVLEPKLMMIMMTDLMNSMDVQ